MIAFAANSLLTRGALDRHLIDAPSFTLIRLIGGAVMLALLLAVRRAASFGPAEPDGPDRERGSWSSALALAGYAVAFTLAYVSIGAGVGALLLFGAVQVTMIGTGFARGDRPLGRDWFGLALAMAGIVWLTVPGASAPDFMGAALMLVAGACWGVYSIAGRGSRDPLAATSGNFWRASILAIVALGVLASRGGFTTRGALFAVASGALASGVGYTLWYSALPALGAWRASLVQLTVPILTGFAAVLLLGEAVSTRLVIAGVLVTTGVWITLRGGKKGPRD